MFFLCFVFFWDGESIFFFFLFVQWITFLYIVEVMDEFHMNLGVKLWFTNLYCVGFYSVPNLIVILFNFLYPVFVVGIYCKGCVIVRESVKTQAIEEWSIFAGSLRLSIPRSNSCALHMLECEESGQMETAVSREYLASKAFLWDTHEIFCSANLSSLIHVFCAYTIYTHITHKCNKELLRENPS